MKAGTKKGLAAVAAVGMAAVIGVGVWAGVTFGREKVDFGQNMLVTPSDGEGMKINAVALTEDGETVQRLTATVTPADATDVKVDWSIEWGETTVSWGSGSQGTVTDYVTVTPTSDGALTADVKCLDAFGTQAIVTASIRGRSDVSATCLVDFVQKYEDVSATLKFQNGTGSQDKTWTLGSSTSVTAGFPASKSTSELAAFNGSGSVTAAYSDVYTIDGGAASVNISYAYTDEYVAALAAAGVTRTANSYQTLASSLSGNTATLTAFTADELFGFDGESVTTVQYAAYKSYLASHTNDVMITVKIDVESKEGVVGGSKTYQIKLSDIAQTEFDIQIDEGQIRF